MLATGLSSALTTALRELASAIPSLKRDISDGLLRMLSIVLMNQPLRYGSLTRHSSHSPPPVSQDSLDIDSTVLALRTLGSFNFDGRSLFKINKQPYPFFFYTGHSLLQFVRRCAEHYLSSENQQIRLESVRTCSRLLCLALEGPHIQAVEITVSDVLAKLLIVGITDPGIYERTKDQGQ
jgi:serine/threonine-protein kinase mTOR